MVAIAEGDRLSHRQVIVLIWYVLVEETVISCLKFSVFLVKLEPSENRTD